MLNAKDTNGNGWGVTQQSIAKNIRSFIGRPYVITAKQWVASTEYGNVFDHPFIRTNDVSRILNHQEKYRVATIVDISERDNEYFAIIQVHPKYAHLNLPAFCSPAIYQLDASENDNHLSRWMGLHLAGLDENPAYGARIALLRGTCNGPGGVCIHQLKTAKQLFAVIPKNADVIKAFKKGQPLKGRAFSTDGKSFKLFGNTIARRNRNSISVSTAGFPTSKTSDSLRALGVNISSKKGITKINGKVVDPNSKEFHRIPNKDISKSRVFLTTEKQRQRRGPRQTNEGIREQRQFRERSREDITGSKKGLPDDPTAIQPKDQEKINRITGVKSPVGPGIKGPETHHIFFRNKMPGLKENSLNAIPLSRKNHTELHRLNAKLVKLAQDPTSPPTPRIKDVNVNSNDGREIADAYDNLKHDPGNPVVKESYDNFIDETNKQFDDLLDSGLKVTPLKTGDNPYANSKQMHDDISKNNHLSYFPTSEGFGEGATPKDHPMLKGTKFQIGDEKLVANDVFRIVHDVNGHNKGEPSGFGPRGEQQAFLTHKQLYGPKATRALFTETAGQNNWVNFNKKSGASNRADPKNTIFSEQKAGIFPDSFINRKFHTK